MELLCSLWKLCVLTDHGDDADSRARSGGVLHTDTVAAAVFPLGLADVEAEVAGGVMEADLLICLQLFVILCPGDSWGRFATVASRHGAAVAHFHHHLFPDVQVQSGWF